LIHLLFHLLQRQLAQLILPPQGQVLRRARTNALLILILLNLAIFEVFDQFTKTIERLFTESTFLVTLNI
jgi:hypothetical protein